MTLSPSLSPWSNGGNKRRHAVIDISIKKLLEDDPTLDLQDAIDHACFARNNEVGPLGFSPQQLTYGEGSMIPGIINGNIAIDSEVTDSEAVREHFERRRLARDIFLKADSSTRIKKILRSNVPKYNDETFNIGDKIWYHKDDFHKWDGPAIVTGFDGARSIIFKCRGENGMKRPTNKVKKIHPDEDVDIDEKDVDIDENKEVVEDNLDVDKDIIEDKKDRIEDDKDTNDVDKVVNIDDDEKDADVYENNINVDDNVDKDVDYEEISNKKEKTIRPKRGRIVSYKFFDDHKFTIGKVIKVGKPSGKFKFTCWMKNNDGNISQINFLDQVEKWEYQSVSLLK